MKLHLQSWLVIILGVAVGAGLARATEDPPAPTPAAGIGDSTIARVGALGNPQAIDFNGNQSFSTQTLREGLAGWPEFLLAAHPAAPLADYVVAIRQAMTRGYQHAGFPRARIEAVPDSSRRRILVDIMEGPRFNRGGVRITGAREVPAADLVRCLTEPAPKSSDRLAQAVETILAQQRAPQLQQQTEEAARQFAGKVPTAQLGAAPAVSMPDLFAGNRTQSEAFWSRGEPASFTDDFPSLAVKEVRRHLADRGHPLAEVSVAMEPDDATHLSHLVVTIVDEGPRAVIGAIDVTGCKRSTREDILQATGLEAGQPATPEVLTRAKLALWSSARFYVFDLTLKPRPAPAREVDVSITVDEIADMPSLHEPLTRLQTALVRFANWMTGEAVQTGLAVTSSSVGPAPLQVAFSPHRGLVLLSKSRTGEKVGLAIGPDGGRAFAGTEDRLARFEFGRTRKHWNVFLHLITTADPEATGRRSGVSFGAGFQSASDRSQPAGQGPVDFDLILSPAAACLNLAKDTAPQFEAGEVTIRASEGQSLLRFEEATGALRGWNLAPETAGRKQNHAGSTPESLTIRPGQADFDQLEREIDALRAAPTGPVVAGNSFTELLEKQPLVRSLVAEALGKETAGAGDGEARLLLLARLIKRLHALPEVQAWFSNVKPKSDSPFTIPPDSRTVNESSLLAGLFGAYFYQLTFTWLPDAWPAKLARELFYMMAGQTKYTPAVLEELYRDPRMGPIGSVLTAQLLRKFNAPLAWRFARRALEHGSPEEFRNDWQMLFDPQSRFGGMARDVLGLLGDLTDEEVKILAGLLPGADAALWQRAATELRQRQDVPPDTVLQPYLDEWWKKHMQPDLEDRIGVMMAPGPVDAVINAVSINGEPVSRRLAQQVAKYPQEFSWIPIRPRPTGAPVVPPSEQAFARFLNLMLVGQDFTARGGKVPDEHLDRLVSQIVQTRYKGNRGAFDAALARQGLTLADQREWLRLRAIFEYLSSEEARNAPPPGDDEINRVVAAGPPAQEHRNLRAISVRRNPLDPNAGYAQAEALRAQVVAGNSFDQVWASADASRIEGVRQIKLPKVTPRDLRPEVAKVAFTLAPNETGPVVESGDSFLVIHLDSVGFVSPDELRRQARDKLVRQKQSGAALAYLDRLRAGAIVRTLADPAQIATNVIPASAGTLRFEMEALAVTDRLRVMPIEISDQPLDNRRWSEGRQVYCSGQPDGWLEWELTIANEAEYQLALFGSRTPESCRVQVSIDDKVLGPPLELFAPSLQPSGAYALGKRRLTAGSHRLRCTIVGRHPSSNGYRFGLDALDLILPPGSPQLPEAPRPPDRQ